MKRELLNSTLVGTLSGLVLLASPGLGWAQGDPGAPPPADQAKSPAPSELVVTGSRIPRNEFTSSAPLQVVTSEQAVLQGLVDTATLLQTAPIASGSFQQNGLLSNVITTGGPGVDTISLRGLGANRTLVLLNGRRVGPAGVRGTVGPVDLNVIPESMIDRVEILKDGASSIYGSDAVAGVVNFITKTNYNGGEISVYGNTPFADGGGQQFEVNGNWGKTLDRAHFNVGFDYIHQAELSAGERPYTSCALDLVSDPTTGQSLDYIDPRTGHQKCFNAFTGVAETATTYGGGFQYAEPGVTYPGPAQGNNIAAIFPTLAAMGFVRSGRGTFAGGADNTATYPYQNDDSPLYARQSAIQPFTRYTAFASGGYELSPSVNLYTELLFNRRQSAQHGYQQIFPTIAADNPNNPFTDVNGISYDALPIIAIKSDASQVVNYGRAVLGLKGDWGSAPVKNLKWDIYGEYSESSADYSGDFVYNDRLNAVTGPGVACDPTQITISGPVSCISIPFFSQRVLAGQFTPAEQAFLFGNATGNTKYVQAMVEGSVSADVLQLPAGPVGAALGFTLRHEKIDDEPSAAEAAGNFYNQTAAAATKGTDLIKEAFGEIHVPIINETPGFKSLTIEGSARFTDYRSYGANWTYKLGFDWQIIPALRVRGTWGTSFRAPALYELYLGNQTSFLDQQSIDPCIRYENSPNANIQKNCAAAGLPTGYTGGSSGALIVTGGGAGVLKAETSRAKTISVIFTPVRDFSLGVDYFDVRVHNEIREFGANNIVTQCYRSAQYPTDPLCGLFVRDADPASPDFQGITSVNDSFVNVAEEINRGIDVNARVTHDFGGLTATLNGQATWQLRDVTQLLGESVPEDFNGTTVEPQFTGQIQAKLEKGDWTLFWNVDLFGHADDTKLSQFQFTDTVFSNTYGQDVRYKQFTEFTAYHSVTVRRKMGDWTFEAGVQNLLDQTPPALSGDESFRLGYSALNAYDLLGRRAFVMVDRKF